jgi:organic hydroperoxide reductase OsmC/OhrA
MEAAFPHHFEVTLSRDGTTATIEALNHASFAGGPPRPFGGEAHLWSPEELLLASASLCVMTTFQVYAAKERLPIGIYRCVAEATLDRTKGGPAFTRIVLRVDMTVAASDVERAEKVLQAAKRDCIISNTLKIPVQLESTLKAA